MASLNENSDEDEFLKYFNIDVDDEGDNLQHLLESENQLILQNQESESVLVLARTKEYNKADASRSKAVGKATLMLGKPSQNQLAPTPRTPQCNHTDTGSGVETAVNRLQRKRERDREYRERKKESRKKLEEELQASLRQNALLLERLESANTIIEDYKRNSGSKQNIWRQCKAVFRLNFPNDEAKAEATKIVCGLQGITKIDMDMKENQLTLRGDFDDQLLRYQLNNICDAKLVSFYDETETRKKDAKKDEKKEETTRMFCWPTPPQPCYSGSPPPPPLGYYGIPQYSGMNQQYYYHGTAELIKKVAIIFIFVLLGLFLVRYAIYPTTWAPTP